MFKGMKITDDPAYDMMPDSFYRFTPYSDTEIGEIGE